MANNMAAAGSGAIVATVDVGGVHFPVLGADAYSFVNITTATTTVVKSGAGVFKGIAINSIGTTVTITIYDNTAASGTKIATISGVLPLQRINFGVKFSTGLTIVTTGVAAADMTVMYL